MSTFVCSGSLKKHARTQLHSLPPGYLVLKYSSMSQNVRFSEQASKHRVLGSQVLKNCRADIGYLRVGAVMFIFQNRQVNIEYLVLKFSSRSRNVRFSE